MENLVLQIHFYYWLDNNHFKRIMSLPRLINPSTDSQEEIEDAISEICFNENPGFVVLEGKDIIGAMAFSQNDWGFCLLHIGSQRPGVGKLLMDKLEGLKPKKISLSSRPNAFGFYQKLNFKRGDRYGDFFKEF